MGTVNAITNGTHSYLFKIIKSGPYMRIGIDDGQMTDNNFTENKYSQNWGYDTDGHLWSKGSRCDTSKKYGIRYGDGDIVNMNINMFKNTLSFTVNNKKQRDILINHSLNGYRVAIYMYYKSYSIKIMPSKNDEEQKERENQNYPKELIQSLQDKLDAKHSKEMMEKTEKINEQRVIIQTLRSDLHEINQQKSEFAELIQSLQKEAESLKTALIEKENE